MKIQLIGPISAIEGCDYAALHEVAGTLRTQGHEVFNPAEIAGGDTSRSLYMRAAIGGLLNADAVYLMPGFQASGAARTLLRNAVELGLEILNPAAVVLPERDEPDD